MIHEIVKYYTTPCSEWAKKFGYLKELIGIESRYRRFKNEWSPHLKQCHQAVIEFCEKNPKAQSIAIFGSGLLHEIPIEYLLKRMKIIFLVDLVFPNEIRLLAKANPSIHLIEKDLSGSLEGLSKGVMKIRPIRVEAEDEADLFVSANLLSQLPILPLKWVNKKRLVEQKFQAKFAQEIQKNHLRFLKYLSRPVLLFTDTERVFKDTNHKILHIENSVHDLALPSHQQQWLWNLAPRGELDKDFSLELTVKSFLLSHIETFQDWQKNTEKSST